MIKIGGVKREQLNNFWSHCHFHPTDAIEDEWGKRILERIADDKAARTVRMYAMLEDIVTMDQSGKLCYDFSLNDLRLDYMVRKGFNILLSYNFMPECIAKNKNSTSVVAKGKTRYKGKLINTSVPTDYKLWEEICRKYTEHIVERYGINTVSNWYLQCFNEPDTPGFFMSELPIDAVDVRIEEYSKLYKGFADGILSVSPKLKIGGPGLAYKLDFLEGVFDFINKNKVRMDFISLHTYGTSPRLIGTTKPLAVENHIVKHKKILESIEKFGLSDREIVYDEWGAATCGFFNSEDYPELLFRETEIFSAYYISLIDRFIKDEIGVSKMMLCLSGQHEMTEDFSGFRNFFTLNFFAKPIYNAFVLAAKLKGKLLGFSTDNEYLKVIPTKSIDGEMAILIGYSEKNFREDIKDTVQKITFEEDIIGKKVTLYRIDKNTTNPYRLYQKMGKTELDEEDVKVLRAEGELIPESFVATENFVELSLSANAVLLLLVENY